MARREPTAEQKQRADERRERFRGLADAVARMTDDERAALVARVGAVVTVEGHALSPFNTCLVLNQLPTASMVGGFRQWKDHGRSVRKGEHGLMIWVPTADKPDGVPKRAGFIMGTVFDVTQTEPSADRGPAERTPDGACWKCRNPAGFFRNYGAGTPVYCDACEKEARERDRLRQHTPRFDERECGGAFDGFAVTSDADPGL